MPDISARAHEGSYLAATLPVLDLALGAVGSVARAAARRSGAPGAGAQGLDTRGRRTRGHGTRARGVPPGSDGSTAVPLPDATPVPAPVPDPERVAAAFASDRLLRVDGEAVDSFAPLSGFFRTADGWVRTHANYPHHRARLLALLGLPDDAARDDLADRLGTWSAEAVEDGAAEAGAIAVRVRTEEEWRASAPGRAASSGPLVRTTVRDDRARPGDRSGRAAQADLRGEGHGAGAPDRAHGGDRTHGDDRTPGDRADDRTPGAPGSPVLAGVRVLDLTRVIAGPVATRTLALLGADVLRLDPPWLPELELQHRDTGQGKRSALLDLRTSTGRALAQELLDGADVIVTGYRPPRAGSPVEALGLRLPAGVVHGRVSAWGPGGPWSGRRGFDSIVQAASGIAWLESPDGETPGALPAQALDHASGYLLAAGVVDALAATAEDGQGRDVEVSLARTATELLDAPGRDPEHGAPRTPGPGTVVGHRVRLGDDDVTLTTARPALPGYDDHRGPARPWGGDEPRWSVPR